MASRSARWRRGTGTEEAKGREASVKGGASCSCRSRLVLDDSKKKLFKVAADVVLRAVWHEG